MPNAELSYESVFEAPPPASTPAELSFDQVFGSNQKELSHEEVFGSPAPPPHNPETTQAVKATALQATKAFVEGAGIPTSLQAAKDMVTGFFSPEQIAKDAQSINEDLKQIPSRIGNLGKTLSESAGARVIASPLSPESFGTYGTVVGGVIAPKILERLAPVKGGEPNAIERSNAQVEARGTPLGVETRPAGEVPQPGDSDYVIGEAQGKEPGGVLPHAGEETPVPPQAEGVLGSAYRAMSEPELIAAIQSGHIKSQGTMQLPIEKALGLTGFADNPKDVSLYADINRKATGKSFIVEVSKTPDMRPDWVQLPELRARKLELESETEQLRDTLSKKQGHPDAPIFEDWINKNEAELSTLNGQLLALSHKATDLPKGFKLPYIQTPNPVPIENIRSIIEVSDSGERNVTNDFIKPKGGEISEQAQKTRGETPEGVEPTGAVPQYGALESPISQGQAEAGRSGDRGLRDQKPDTLSGEGEQQPPPAPTPTVTRQNFIDLAEEQRGKPEAAMVRAKFVSGGGVINPVIEHVGDLIHRMNDKHTFSEAGYEAVKDKVNKSLKYLRDPYGFEKEFEGNIRSNSEFQNKSVESYRRELYSALDEYANAHEQLPTYNQAQKLAQDAAISLGRRNFTSAERALDELKSHLGSKQEWIRFAREGLAPAQEAAQPVAPTVPKNDVGISEARTEAELGRGSVEPGIGAELGSGLEFGKDYINKGGDPRLPIRRAEASGLVGRKEVGIVHAELERLRGLRNEAAAVAEARPNDPVAQANLDAADRAQREWRKELQPVLTKASDALREAYASSKVNPDVGTYQGLADLMDEHFKGKRDLTPQDRTYLQKVAKGVQETRSTAARTADSAVRALQRASKRIMTPDELRADISRILKDELYKDCIV